jgi:glutathione peroxidase-family protein
MKNRLSFNVAMFCCLLITTAAAVVEASSGDKLAECEQWAARGDCKPNGRPYFMQQNCPTACYKATYRPPETSTSHSVDEFYQLSANDANGKVMRMENFEGYVTVIVNVARLCDYTELFYNTLEHMHAIYPYALEILAFPFNSPGATIDSCMKQIETVEKNTEHKIHIMEPMDGPDSHPVFDYLKNAFNVKELDAGFAYYFFINPDGNIIEMHYGASYNALKRFVDRHVKEDL